MGNDIEEEEMDSSDEALCEMLGLTSIDNLKNRHDENADDSSDRPSACPSQRSVEARHLSLHSITTIVKSMDLTRLYESESICILPEELGVPVHVMRRITDELVWARRDDCVRGGCVDKTYETIKVWKRGVTEERRTLTRLENFVNHHDAWKELCHGHLARCVSSLVGQEMVLFKEKLNMKPSGGSGFAPHLDTPSLRVALGESGPKTFVTVMVAIDDMTEKNGCLRVCKGAWSQEQHCAVIEPSGDNPDGDGRAGAIPAHVAESLEFEPICCKGGRVACFNGWAPHRSAANASPFPRRAVFLTYNPKSEGDFHDTYYNRMGKLRDDWRGKVGLQQRQQLSADEQSELDALATIPRI